MRWHHRLAALRREWFHPSSLDREMAEELRFHFDRQVDANLAAGMPVEQARRAATLAIGNAESIRESSRAARGGALARQFGRDALHGLRLIAKAPMFACSAIAIIGVAIAAVTAIFAVVHGVILEPLPFPEPDRLVQIWGRSPRYARDAISAADVRDWKAETRAFEDIALYSANASFNLTDGTGEPERLLGARISANSLDVLRVAPAIGRGFQPGEDDIGREHVVILGDGLWRRRFGADPAIVGRTIRLSGVPHDVIGIMSPGFSFPERPFDVWVPLTINPKELAREVPGFGLRGIARLTTGVDIGDAQRQLDAAAARLAGQHAMNKDVGVEVVGLRDNLVGDVRRPLYTMLAAVLALLGVAALNLAGLLSARAIARGRELAVRLALGASRLRLVAQLVAEIAPLLLLGGLAGMIAATVAVRALVPLAPPALPRMESVAVDGTVLLFSFVVLALCGLLATVLPAAQAWRGDLTAATREDGRASAGSPRHNRARSAIVVAQIALSVPLLAAGTLLAKSFVTAVAVDPGFSADQVLSVYVAIPRSKYATDERVAQFETRILERVQELPGVESAAIVNRLPLAGVAQNVQVEFEDSRGDVALYGRRVISTDYFTTLRIPLREGRPFDAGDRLGATPVAIVDERIAAQRWPGQSAIGKRLRVAPRGEETPPWVEIVGVVGHVKHDGVDVESIGAIYWDYRQSPQDRAVIVARTTAAPAGVAGAIGARIRELDPDQPVYDVRTLDEVFARSVSQRWLAMALVGAFASMALFLCCVGVYGVMAFGVTRQQREFGIRLALGATRGAITRGVVNRGLVLALGGSGLGLAAAWVVARGMQSMLFNVPPHDIASFTTATIAVLAVALIASYLPARRAASIDPVTTLRAE